MATSDGPGNDDGLGDVDYGAGSGDDGSGDIDYGDGSGGAGGSGDGSEDGSDEDGPRFDSAGQTGVFLGSELSFAAFGPDPTAVVDLGVVLGFELAALRPSLMGLVQLAGVDFDALSHAERIEAVHVLEQHRAWLDGVQQQALASVAANDTSGKNFATEEVAAALSLSPQTAVGRMRNAQRLRDRLPNTMGLLLEGRISGRHAQAAVEASDALPDDLIPQLESRVLGRAPEQTVAQFKQSLARAVNRLDPATAEERHAEAVAKRCVRIADAGDGMVWLSMLLRAAEGHACYRSIARTAKHSARLAARLAARAAESGTSTDGAPSHSELSRTSDQRRADTFVECLLGGAQAVLESASGDASSKRPSLEPLITVTVGVDTLTGAENEPAWLDSYGPITAEAARQIAHDPTGTWRRLVTDPVSGQALDLGRKRYRPTVALTEYVQVRDGVCVFPICNRPARRTQMDHIERYPDGPTAEYNLEPTCDRHHHLKHEAGWKVERNPEDGTTTWTSPTGRQYVNVPPRRWPYLGEDFGR